MQLCIPLIPSHVDIYVIKVKNKNELFPDLVTVWNLQVTSFSNRLLKLMLNICKLTDRQTRRPVILTASLILQLSYFLILKVKKW